jgi:hypothetical protein
MGRLCACLFACFLPAAGRLIVGFGSGQYKAAREAGTIRVLDGVIAKVDRDGAAASRRYAVSANDQLKVEQMLTDDGMAHRQHAFE